MKNSPGKPAPARNCKHPITVPAKSREIKIHTPEQFEQGGRNTADQLVLKPLAREKSNFNPIMAAGIGLCRCAIFAGALLGGKMGLFKDDIFTTAAGLALISPLLALAGYSFLYDEELEHYKGISLFIRSAICGLIYALLWGVFAYVSDLLDRRSLELGFYRSAVPCRRRDGRRNHPRPGIWQRIFPLLFLPFGNYYSPLGPGMDWIWNIK